MAGIQYNPSVDTVKLGKTLENMSSALAKIVKKFISSKINLPCRFTNEETRFISLKDLSCILRCKRIFRQYVKFHTFSILATQLTRAVKNTKGMKL